MKKILCVDDCEMMQDILKESLVNEGYDVFHAYSEAEIFQAIDAFAPDLMILDLVLQDTDGLSILKKLQQKGITLPVIMISGRGEYIDRVIGIEAGADDYLAKPFNKRELIARVRAVLRRSERQIKKDHTEKNDEQLLYCFGKWILNPKNYQVVSVNGISADLTTHEFVVLQKLVSAPYQAFPREQLFDVFNKRDMDASDRAVDIQIARIRSKLGDDPKNPRYIKTLRNVGYMFCCDVERMSHQNGAGS